MIFKHKKTPVESPSVQKLEQQLEQERHKIRFIYAMRTTIYTVLAVAALAILVATLWLPVLQIYGASMTPTLESGQLIVVLKNSEFKRGDVIAFYYNNKILVKRVIAGPGEWVNIDDDGTVSVNQSELEEDYLTEKSFGKCDISLPYQVPDGQYFVIGDHRESSMDSRSTAVGCVPKENVVGKLKLRVWPLNKIKIIN